jgi:hypothetical protein
VPYQRLLDDLLRSVDGQGALLLDGEGEVVMESGARDERLRLIGAYQGISLSVLRGMVRRYDSGQVECVLCRYATTVVILRPLKDGYYLVLSLPPDGRVAEGVHRSRLTQERMNTEL